MVAVKALQVVRSANGSLQTVGQILETDPILAARILRIANSAAYATRESAISVSQAVSRLGVRTLETVLVEVSAQGVFASRNKDINTACQKLWEHSLAVGMVARDLATLLFGKTGEEFAQAAFLAGLLHDIGKPVLAAVMLETEKKAPVGKSFLPMETWLQLIEGAHRTVGLLVAVKWDMPALVRKGMADLQNYDESEPLSMSNFVRLANILVKRSGLDAGMPTPSDLEAEVQEGCRILSLPVASVEKVLSDLPDRVRQRTA